MSTPWQQGLLGSIFEMAVIQVGSFGCAGLDQRNHVESIDLEDPIVLGSQDEAIHLHTKAVDDSPATDW